MGEEDGPAIGCSESFRMDERDMLLLSSRGDR